MVARRRGTTAGWTLACAALAATASIGAFTPPRPPAAPHRRPRTRTLSTAPRWNSRPGDGEATTPRGGTLPPTLRGPGGPGADGVWPFPSSLAAFVHPAKASDQASVVEARREISATVKGWLEDRDGSPDSRFAGVYTDPNHPGCRRQIRVQIHSAIVTGEDGDPGCPPKDPSKDSHWRLLGKIISDTEILVDFSPKGGPKDLEGKWCRGCGDHGGISWPDGNE